MVVSQDTMGWAAAAAAADPAPVHCSAVSVEMIDSHWVAVVLSSAARLAYAVAAAMSGPAPAPAYMSAEVISGGSCKIKNHFCIPFLLSVEFRFVVD